MTTIYSGDVEHFRPKSAFNNAPKQNLVKPAYYWLAADWNNLLFACPFCNQTNTHEISEDGTIKEVVQDKWNLFPLISEQYRLNHTHGSSFFANRTQYNIDFTNEESERLLLDPCADEVSRYFKYDDDGAVMANDGLNDFEKRRADTSIDVLALRRLNLTQSRRERIIQIRAQIKRVENAIVNFDKYTDKSEEERTWFEGILREELAVLKKFKDADQEYAGLARHIINQYFSQASFL